MAAGPSIGRSDHWRPDARIPVTAFAIIAIAFIGMCYAIGTLLRERDRTRREHPAGDQERAEFDANLDGKPDRWHVYRNDVHLAERRDTDFNGVPDAFSTFKDGVLVQTDIRPNDSPIVTRRYLYMNMVLREEWVDEDADGKFDYRIEYDPFGKPSGHLPVPTKK
jgi:hypothetical protein